MVLLFLFVYLLPFADLKPTSDPYLSLLSECRNLADNGQCDLKCVGLNEEFEKDECEKVRKMRKGGLKPDDDFQYSKNITIGAQVNLRELLSNEFQFCKWLKELEMQKRQDHNQQVTLYLSHGEFMQQRNECLVARKYPCTISVNATIVEQTCKGKADGHHAVSDCSREVYYCEGGSQPLSSTTNGCITPGFVYSKYWQRCVNQHLVEACKGRDPWCKKKADGAYGTKCDNKYVECVGGEDFYFLCESGKGFNTKRRVCTSDCYLH